MSKEGEKGAGKVWYAHVEAFKYSLTLATNRFLRSSPSGSPASGWRVHLGEGEEGERRAREGKETAVVVVECNVTVY